MALDTNAVFDEFEFEAGSLARIIATDMVVVLVARCLVQGMSGGINRVYSIGTGDGYRLIYEAELAPYVHNPETPS